MAYTIKQKIYNEKKKLNAKLYQLNFSMIQKQKKMIKTSQEKAVYQEQKIINKIKKEKIRKIKKYKKKTAQKIKNLEREKKWHKKVKYKKKPKTRSKEFQKLLVLIQKKRRLECADDKWYTKCYTCDNIRHRKDMHWWHFISRAKKNTARRDINIHSQCPNCNAFHYWRPLEYRKQFIKDYWKKKYNELIEASKQPIDKRKYNMEWIEKQIKINKDIISQKE